MKGVKFLSEEEGRKLFARLARRYLDMSTKEFLQAREAGLLPYDGEDPHVDRLLMFTPLVGVE